MNPVWQLVIGWLTLTGLVGFFSMGIDKARAQTGQWRISEKAFYILALVGGVFGVAAGSSVFHHKTLKDSFLEVVLVIVVLWLLVLAGLQELMGPPLG